MAIPASNIIDRVLNKFRYRDPVLPMVGAITNVQATLQVTDFVPNIGKGSILLVGDEYMLVTATSGTGPMTITIIRGWLSSTAVAHANDDPVYVNPRVLGDEVLDYVNECLDQLYPKLIMVDTDALVYNPSVIGYGLSASVGSVIRVDYLADVTAKNWVRIGDWNYIPQADTTDFPNGKGISIRAAMPNSAKIRVIFAKPFTRITASSDDLLVVAGLQEYMTDIPYYYAMHKIMSTEEVDRSDSSGAASHQRAQDVQPFVALRTADWYNARYRDILLNARNRQRTEIQASFGIGGYGN